MDIGGRAQSILVAGRLIWICESLGVCIGRLTGCFLTSLTVCDPEVIYVAVDSVWPARRVSLHLDIRANETGKRRALISHAKREASMDDTCGMCGCVDRCMESMIRFMRESSTYSMTDGDEQS